MHHSDNSFGVLETVTAEWTRLSSNALSWEQNMQGRPSHRAAVFGTESKSRPNPGGMLLSVCLRSVCSDGIFVISWWARKR